MSDAQRRYWRSVRWLTVTLLGLWLMAAFGVVYFARELSFGFFGWTFGFWWAAQGALLVFVALVVLYQVVARRLDEQVVADEGD